MNTKPKLTSNLRSAFFYSFFFLLLSGLFGYQLHLPATHYFDEFFHIQSARELIAPTFLNFYDPAHPLLGKMLISLSLICFGDHPFAWRLPSLLSGIACVFTLYFITKRLTRSSLTAFFAAFLYALDCSLLVLSRTAMLNTSMQLLMLLSLFCLVLLESEPKLAPKRHLFFLLCAVFLGASWSVRIFSFTFPAVLAFFAVRINLREGKGAVAIARDILIYFILIPALIFTAVYLRALWIPGKGWAEMLRLPAAIFEHHLSRLNHRDFHGWWAWPLMLMPVLFYGKQEPSIVRVIFCIGNPAVYWVIVPSMYYVFMMFREKRNFLEGFLVSAFLLQWLPWAFVKRVVFLHYFETAVPFAVMGIALILTKLWHSGRAGRGTVITYGLLVLTLFIYWYPLLVGIPISRTFFYQHMWLKPWLRYFVFVNY